ncbi:MAG: shikimate kinase [Thermodesulfovibrionales bacterium]
MANIVLTGFMGTGKTSVSRELARMLGMKLIDADEEIERTQKTAISEIFRLFGEQRFREIETETLRTLAKEDKTIISTGGGAVLREENMKALRENGMIFCLSASPETIYERTRHTTDRPLLNVDDPLARIRELLNSRMPYYEKAGTMIDTENKTPHQVAEEIARLFRCRT